MKRFLVSDPRAAVLVSQLSGESTESEITRSFARASFSLITEPGDRFAGDLIRLLTPEVVLELLISKSGPEQFSTKLSEVGVLDEFESKFGLFDSAFSAAVQRWVPRLKLADVLAALEQGANCGARLLTPENSNWPGQLDDLAESSPHCLWYRSGLAEPDFSKTSIAIVGSRNATSYGEWVTSEIVSDCASRDLTVVSGGAYGIDAVAHRSALVHTQATIAFMAGGIDRWYPSGNVSLFEKIVERGALVAEQAPGASPTKWRFLQRNRLIAALAKATIVVEAGQRSGALNTVTHALELGRDVGAVPGPITSQSSAGCNRLISEGLVSSVCAPSDAADLTLGKLGWFQPELQGLGAFETRALDAMGSRSLPEDRVASNAGLTSREAAIALGQLSLLGLVKQTDRGWLKLPLEGEQRPKTGGQ